MKNPIQQSERGNSVFLFLSNSKQRVEERIVSRWKRDADDENGMRSNNSVEKTQWQ